MSKPNFRSSDFIFRHTAVGQAFAQMGIASVPMVRERKLQGLLRDQHDKKNIRPSRLVDISPKIAVPGAFGKSDNSGGSTPVPVLAVA